VTAGAELGNGAEGRVRMRDLRRGPEEGFEPSYAGSKKPPAEGPPRALAEEIVFGRRCLITQVGLSVQSLVQIGTERSVPVASERGVWFHNADL
jgi:hypothetical protein